MSLCRELWAMHAGRELTGLLAPIHELSRYRGAASEAAHRRLCEELPAAAEAVYSTGAPRITSTFRKLPR